MGYTDIGWADPEDIANGLGGLDISGGGAVDGVNILIGQCTQTIDLSFLIKTYNNNTSQATYPIPDGTISNNLFIPFAALSTTAGTGADITDVHSIEMELLSTLNGTTDVNIGDVRTGRSLAATLSDALLIDNDLDGAASPGDTLRYTTIITNPSDLGGADATGAVFTLSPDSNSSLVIGSVATTQGSVTTGNTGGDSAVGVNIGSLADGASATITFNVLIDQPLPPSITQLSSQGTVTSDTLTLGFSTDDPNAGGTSDATVSAISKTTIGGTIFNDLNENGTQNDGEGGLSGVTLDLYKDTDANKALDGADVLLASVTTGSDGTFGAGLPNVTDYLVDITDTGNTLGGLTLVAGTTPADVTVAPGGTTNDVRFGYKANGTIGDTVWIDSNGNGTMDTGEQGVSGVTLALYNDQNSDKALDPGDTLISTVTTGTGGTYDFTSLVSGDYIVKVTDTDDVLGGYASTTTEPMPATLGRDEDKNDADFGYQGSGSIGGSIWEDDNGDITRDPDEKGIDGVTLDLYRDQNGDAIVDGGDTLLETQTTASGGTFNFTHLPPGNYLVKVTDTSEALVGYELPENRTLAVNLNPGENLTNENIAATDKKASSSCFIMSLMP